ncbi:MAG: hypothetical protein LIO37_02395 [Clostridiales bacterium]|nr:hypothetical protein [Clostridiales bacterium]
MVIIVGSLAGAKIFRAKAYASVLTVQDAEFEEDLAETLDTDAIALMDTASARKLGDREIGTLSEVVSQYDVSSAYTQIDLNGSPIKVSALAYADFFKWMGNKDDGVPGYVTVDPVSMSADYVALDESMIYVPSAYFGQDADRYIFMHYPTLIRDTAHFEVDEYGNPYYVSPVYEHTIGLFGGTTVAGAILLDPVTGDITYYDAQDIPEWVDYVYDGDLLCTQYNWYGELSGGFWNSLFAKKGCKTVTTYVADEEEYEDDSTPTSDYGYIAKDGDIWIYTGVTSMNSDSSNIGFLLANQRTGEARFYSVAGADEKSAMDAAEGEVQEKGYQASFPSLINVGGSPTYIMVLKDDSGLVKLYAAVNVEQYNLVTTASTQEECIEKYKELLGISESTTDGNDTDGDGESGTDSDGDGSEGADGSTDGNSAGNDGGEDGSTESVEKVAVGEIDFEIAAVRYITVDGNTWIYLLAEDGTAYRALAAENEAMMILEAGDTVHISYTEDGEILECSRQ